MKITVLGGGTAGWLTALFLQKAYKDVSVTVVEDPNRPPIIAGESGTATIAGLFNFLDIDLNDWVSKVNATPKMGGKFTGWTNEGSEFIHPLQTELITDQIPAYFTRDILKLASALDTLQIMDSMKDKEYYLRSLVANNITLADAFYAGEFIKQQRVPLNVNEHPIEIGCMWHFESRETAAYLKNIALNRNITLVEGEYLRSVQIENGNIEKIILADGRELKSNWFFDCSGFSRLLLGKVLNEPVEDWTQYFPARSVIAWWDKPKYQVTTNAHAMEYGWAWNINLIHRSGNGYLYDPDHLTEDQALEEIQNTFGKIEPVAKLSFTPGMMRNCFKNNVIGVGLSAGFMEPLEANGIAVIYETLGILFNLWNPNNNSEEVKKLVNNAVWTSVTDIKDFLSLHYRGGRSDTDFWLSHKNDKKRIPDSLSAKLEKWQRYFEYSYAQNMSEGYSTGAWLTVLQGLKIFPTDKLKEKTKDLEIYCFNQYQKNKTLYENYVKIYPTIDEWVQRKINA
jgi:tryptophan halogenase